MPHRRSFFTAATAAIVLCCAAMQVAQAAPSAQDRRFVIAASRAGNAEVLDGRLALQKSSAPSVRRVAARMIHDHTLANQQLAAIAASEGIPAPTTPDPTDRAAMAEQRRLHGAAFDDAYLTDQETAHVQAIALFRNEIANGSDPRIRAFARRTLPILRMHLAMIRAARGGR